MGFSSLKEGSFPFLFSEKKKNNKNETKHKKKKLNKKLD
jgi:hypothetical protein